MAADSSADAMEVVVNNNNPQSDDHRTESKDTSNEQASEMKQNANEEDVRTEEEKQQEEKEQQSSDTNTNSKDLSSSSAEDRIAAAIQKSRARRPSTIDERDGSAVLHSVWTFGINDFTSMGIGIYLYFKFLRQLAVLFFILCLFSTPLLLSCLSSGKLEKTSLQFEQTTIGNLGAADQYDSISYPSYVDLSPFDSLPYLDNWDSENNSLPKKDAGVFFGFMDLTGTVAFMCFLVFISLSQERAAKEAADAAVTVADYSIRVTGLPADCYNREEIQHHFQTKNNYGQVVDVAICYNDTGIIKKYIRKSSAINKYQAAVRREEEESKLASLQKKIKKQNKQIADIQRKYDKRTICAYVTFNDAHIVPQVLHDYPNTFLARCFMAKKHRFRNKYKIKIEAASEPSEIIYDNMRYGKCNVCMRRTFTLFASIVVIAVSCGMSLGAAAFRADRNLQGTETDTCPEIIENPLEKLQAGGSQYDDDCLCSKLSLDVMYKQSDKCADYAADLLIGNVLVASSAIVIIAINLGLKFISRALVRFEKHKSLTRMERELTWKMFVGMFFNTALIILLVNSSWDGPNLFVIGNGEYDDFVPEWYEVVGVSLLLTMLINIVNPHLIPIVAYPFKQCALKCKIRKMKQNADKLTQREINEAFDGIQFTLAEKYAIVCNTIYVSFFYSSGMPILLFVAAITFIVTYLCDKFVLLRYCNRPPMYKEDIAQFALVLIRPVIYIHLAVSIWVFGQTTVLTHHRINDATTPSDDDGVRNEFEQVIFNRNAFWSFLALIGLMAFDIVTNILKTLKLTACVASVAKGIARLLCGSCCPKYFKSDNVIDVQEGIRLYLEEVQSGKEFESYLASLQEVYGYAYFQEDTASETRGLLIKEQPLYIKQKLLHSSQLLL